MDTTVVPESVDYASFLKLFPKTFFVSQHNELIGQLAGQMVKRQVSAFPLVSSLSNGSCFRSSMRSISRKRLPTSTSRSRGTLSQRALRRRPTSRCYHTQSRRQRRKSPHYASCCYVQLNLHNT